MDDVDHKKDLILNREARFADAVAVAVLDKPKITVWMILLPILFVYFIHQQQKFSAGRKQFTEDFMKTRRRALDAAGRALETGADPDIEAVARQATIPDAVQPPYVSWVGVLVDHYLDLLTSEGESFESLVRSAYGSRTNYLLTLNRLNTVEKQFYTALKPHLNQTTEGVAEIIAAIEHHSARLRRDMAESIFP